MLVWLKGSDRWVVFLNGRMLGNFKTFSEAYAALTGAFRKRIIKMRRHSEIKERWSRCFNEIEESVKDNLINFEERKIALKPEGGGTSRDWLSGLKKGDRFICADNRTENPYAGEFWVVHKEVNETTGEVVGVNLYTNLNQEAFLWAIPSRFTKQWRLIKVLETPPGTIEALAKKEKEHNADDGEEGTTDRPDPS
jgi:hypothetical protein